MDVGTMARLDGGCLRVETTVLETYINSTKVNPMMFSVKWATKNLYKMIKEHVQIVTAHRQTLSNVSITQKSFGKVLSL